MDDRYARILRAQLRDQRRACADDAQPVALLEDRTEQRDDQVAPRHDRQCDPVQLRKPRQYAAVVEAQQSALIDRAQFGLRINLDHMVDIGGDDIAEAIVGASRIEEGDDLGGLCRIKIEAEEVGPGKPVLPGRALRGRLSRRRHGNISPADERRSRCQLGDPGVKRPASCG
jgi:hypothetical protein